MAALEFAALQKLVSLRFQKGISLRQVACLERDVVAARPLGL